LNIFIPKVLVKPNFCCILFLKLPVEESSMQRKSELAMAQEKLKMKECLAEQARQKGMESTYSNYKEDIDVLKEEIQHMKV